MSRYSFLDDYSEGCHPDILAALADTNLVQQTAYGDDEYSEQARALLRAQIGIDVPVHFVASGTLANLIIAASVLRSHEAVIAPVTGHITLREAGAVEATGHKIIGVATPDGKLRPGDVESAIAENAHFPHMAKPRMVYVSNATELGTVYSGAELAALGDVCRANGLALQLDGARLGTALTADGADLTLAQVADQTDIFWIGGTKAGALIGEAIVIPDEQLANDFAFHLKQRGALLAKGRLLGLQFRELFRNDLFFENSRHANRLAQKLSRAIVAAGHELAAPTESNQIFAALPDALIERLRARFAFYEWKRIDDTRSVIRLVTSWATDESQIAAFIALLDD